MVHSHCNVQCAMWQFPCFFFFLPSPGCLCLPPVFSFKRPGPLEQVAGRRRTPSNRTAARGGTPTTQPARTAARQGTPATQAPQCARRCDRGCRWSAPPPPPPQWAPPQCVPCAPCAPCECATYSMIHDPQVTKTALTSIITTANKLQAGMTGILYLVYSHYPSQVVSC